MKMNHARTALRASIATLAFSSASGAIAQSDATGDTASENNGTGNQIIVTAQRRDETIQDIPIAIQAVDGDTLAKTGVDNFAQLVRVSPSFSFTQVGATPIIGIRGASSELSQIAGEASVSTTVDGVPLLRQKYLNAAFTDVGRVEVLRGPQGTISGRNATGGAINVISARPTDYLEGGLDLTVGNYNRIETRGFVSGPLGENVSARLNVETRDRDGYIESPLTGLEFGGREERLGRISFLIEPSDRVELFLSADYYDNNDSRPAQVSLGLYDPALIGSVPPFLDFGGGPFPNGGDLSGSGFGSSSYYDADENTALIGSTTEQADIEMYGFTLNGSIDLSDSATLRFVTGYRKLESFDQYDSVRGPTVINPIVEATEQDQFTQEISLTASLGDSVDVLIGGQYISETAHQQTDVIYFQGLAIGTDLSIFDRQELESFAVFGQVQAQLTPELRLTLGGRYTKDDKEVQGDASFPSNSAPNPFLSLSAEDSWDAFTPRVAIDFQPDDDTTLFASVSRGFKAGGFGSAPSLSGLNPFSPETVWSYEVGLKKRWMDRRLTTNITAFWSDYEDLQYPLYVAPATITRNAGGAQIRGIEFELAAQASENFDLGLNIAYLDAEYQEFCIADPGQPIAPLTCTDPGSGFLGLDLEGNRLPRSPKWNVSSYAAYTFDLGETGELELRGDLNHQSMVYFSAFNFPTTSQGSYTLLDLRLSYRTANERFSIAAFVRNLTDEDYLIGATSLGSALGAFDARAGGALVPASTLLGVVGEPRTYGITGSIRF